MIGITVRSERLSVFKSHEVDMLRLDLLDPVTGGNKHFKLKYNLEAAYAGNATVVTFGGAHSNHVAATAAACADAGIKSCAIIRAHPGQSTPTLDYARAKGMELYFAGKSGYHDSKTFVEELASRIGPVFCIPEGGSNAAGILGCREILPADSDYDYVVLPCGTGTTYAGMLSGHSGKSVFVGISPLKGVNLLPDQVTSMLANLKIQVRIAGDDALLKASIDEHCIISAYAGKGFGKFDESTVRFRRQFMAETGITLDYVYLPKMLAGVTDLCSSGKFKPGSRILVVHTGGTQGNPGFELRYAERLAAVGMEAGLW